MIASPLHLVYLVRFQVEIERLEANQFNFHSSRSLDSCATSHWTCYQTVFFPNQMKKEKRWPGLARLIRQVIVLQFNTLNSTLTYVTQSGKRGLIAFLKALRNSGFKYLVCCSSPMVEATCTTLSHVLHQFPTFQSIHCSNSQQLSFLPF